MKERPRLLIEEWLPASAIGVECMRERGSSSALAPHTFLHVWWARRPLTVSRAAVLASLLPADFPKEVFERLLGFGRPSQEIVQIRRMIDGEIPDTRNYTGYGYERAFKRPLLVQDVAQAWQSMKHLWGEDVLLLDPMAGGGSIPLESIRLGIDTVANEYNPVAATILVVALEYSTRYGLLLARSARHWGKELLARFRKRISPFVHEPSFRGVDGYLYARTVPCPDTGHPTPLVPDWHVIKPARHGNECTPACLLAEPVADRERGTWSVRFVQGGRGAGQRPKAPPPTYVRGKGVSLYTGTQIDDEYIKTMAQQGKMGSQLYAVAVKTTRLEFRPPSPEDLAALQRAEAELGRLQPAWERDGILPTERLIEAYNTRQIMNYGVLRWTDMFAPRQLLAMGVLVEELRNLETDILRTEGEELGKAVITLLALIVDKFADYNCTSAVWHAGRQVIAHQFSQHAYPFKPTFAELAACGAGGGLEWAIDNVLEAYEHLCALPRAQASPPVTITLGSATSLPDLDDRSVTAVVVDPPYLDNVMYSEMADFFYVWLKRTVGHLYPGWFASYLCDHREEAIANPGRFPSPSRKQSEQLARDHYHQMMQRSFRECWRVLRDDGVLTVMFTHKAQEAWEALFESLIASGFTITAAWPVKTESEHSLHQARKNAAQSTVLLAARKRAPGAGVGYWDQQMRTLIRQRVREVADRLQREGLNPVDQLVGTFGAAMEIFSRYDEVRTDTGERVPVGVAIDLASDAVMEWRIEQIAQRSLSDVEAEGRFILLCWDVLGAAEFRFNEAKLIGHAVGMSPDALVAAGLLEKSGEFLRIVSARERRRAEAVKPEESALLMQPVEAPPRRGRGSRRIVGVHPNDPVFRTALDGCHALALRYLEAGIGSARALATRQRWGEDSPVARLMQALVLAAPEAMRQEPQSERDISAQYAEFRAWHALLHPLFGIEPPDWTPKPPEQPTLPGASWEGEEEEGEEDEEET